MTPDMGQGACQAIEDAVILADCLAGSGDIPPALGAYEARRIPAHKPRGPRVAPGRDDRPVVQPNGVPVPRRRS